MAEKKETKKPPAIVLLEYSFTISRLVIVLAAGLTILLSLQAGCSWMALLVRTGVVLLTLGILLYFINWIISQGALEVVTRDLSEAQKVENRSQSKEWKV